MIWRILLEIVFVLALVFAGSSFWACHKSPAHLRRLMADEEQLKRIIDLVGFAKLSADANDIEPISQRHTYGDTIILWEKAHLKSLSHTRNLFALMVAAILATSWWLGDWYFAVSLCTFVALGFSDLPIAAKNNNARHIPSVVRNLIRWRQEADQACSLFCREQHKEYRALYEVIASMPSDRGRSAG
ncbi:MAG: hypothetical protein ACLQVG_02970 [Terriglobia bacterium]